jgi:hypothetical protein
MKKFNQLLAPLAVVAACAALGLLVSLMTGQEATVEAAPTKCEQPQCILEDGAPNEVIFDETTEANQQAFVLLRTTPDGVVVGTPRVLVEVDRSRVSVNVAPKRKGLLRRIVAKRQTRRLNRRR